MRQKEYKTGTDRSGSNLFGNRRDQSNRKRKKDEESKKQKKEGRQ